LNTKLTNEHRFEESNGENYANGDEFNHGAKCLITILTYNLRPTITYKTSVRPEEIK